MALSCILSSVPDRIEGAAAVNVSKRTVSFKEGAQAVSKSFETRRMETGFWTGGQHTKVRKSGRDTVPMSLCVMNVFRPAEWEWKPVHRHVDTLQSSSWSGLSHQLELLILRAAKFDQPL